ncbi:uncharacterized protein L201_002818 [Kwoniella dendrophila CBS 6074]|uniref:DUF7918 domain-containing protein n=1 Tax=Kwoniella dendrophila CBS 6074 TaxID=1295534 RepID=A0AAX4JSN7_9TREE
MLSQGNRKGFEIFIQSEEGENRLKEYKVQHAKGKFPTSQCFVEVIPAPFSIHAIKHDDLNITESDWRCVYHIDGQYIAEYALLRESDSNCVDEIYEEEDGELYGRNLQFIPAKTTDEPKNIHAGSKNLDHIGNIQITIFRGVYKEVSVDLYDESKIETCTLDEKQGKMAYTVGATERHLVEVPEVPSFTWTPSKAKNVNFYRFIFKYRTHVELVKLGLKGKILLKHYFLFVTWTN